MEMDDPNFWFDDPRRQPPRTSFLQNAAEIAILEKFRSLASERGLGHEAQEKVFEEVKQLAGKYGAAEVLQGLLNSYIALLSTTELEVSKQFLEGVLMGIEYLKKEVSTVHGLRGISDTWVLGHAVDLEFRAIYKRMFGSEALKRFDIELGGADLGGRKRQRPTRSRSSKRRSKTARSASKSRSKKKRAQARRVKRHGRL